MTGAVAVAVISGGLKLLGVLLAVWFKSYLQTRPTVSSAGVTIVLFALIGFAFGAVSAGLRGQFEQIGFYYETLTAEAILVFACLALAIEHIRSGGSILSYELHALALWAAFIGAWLAFHGSYSENFIPPATSAYAACAVIGGALVGLFGRSARE